jgi:hypothetical protein
MVCSGCSLQAPAPGTSAGEGRELERHERRRDMDGRWEGATGQPRTRGRTERLTCCRLAPLSCALVSAAPTGTVRSAISPNSNAANKGPGLPAPARVPSA